MDSGTHTGTFSGEHIEVTFTAVPERSDYGVYGSPIWFEYPNPEIESLAILGVDVDPQTLPDDLQAAIYELSSEVSWT